MDYNFSQGQRQLLAIARAILADPRILILYEATSSVDTRTEKQNQEALMHLMSGRTAFDIALRLSTIRQSDQVLVVDNGRIIERGTHESLFTVRASTTTSMGASTGRCSIPYEMGTGFRHWQRNFKTALSLKSSYLCHRGRE